MDNATIQKAVQWVQSNVGETTSKQELADKMQASDLPSEAKDAIRDLPEGQHTKQDVISHLQHSIMAKMAGMGGKIGGFGSGGT